MGILAGSGSASLKIFVVCSVAIGMAVFAVPAQAQETDTYNSVRVGMFAGAFVPNPAHWDGVATLPGLPPLAASGHLSLNTGGAVGGLVGYTFDDFLGIESLRRKINVEFQMGLVNDTFQKLDGTVNVAGTGNVTGSFPLSGHVNTLVGAVDFIFSPFGQRKLGWGDHRITPLIGFGTGFARSDVTLKSFTLAPGVILPINASSSETDPVINFTVGADIEPFPKSFPRLELGIAYQYTRIFSDHLGSGAGIAANSGNVSGHIFGLVLEYRAVEQN